MQKRVRAALIAVSLVLVCAGCNSTNTQLPTPRVNNRPMAARETIQVPAFSAIKANGALNVNITGNSRRNQPIQLMGDATLIKDMDVSVNKGVLTLGLASGDKPGRMRVDVAMGNLHRLDVQGTANVKGKDIGSSGLMLSAKGTGSITLEGVINVRSIEDTGSNQISIRWIDSDNLAVTSSNNSIISLAGRTRILHTTLTNATKLDAKYLRANDIFARTKDTAQATLLPLKRLHAFASEQSNIYYFKNPKLLDENGMRSSSVLALKSWN